MSVKYCEGCGTSVMETMRFCPQCGHRIFSQTPVKPQPTKISQTASNNISQPVTNQSTYIYAGFWERYAAHLIDTCLVTLASLLIGFLSGLIMLVGAINSASPRAIVFNALLGLALVILYFSLMESSNRRATFGKEWLGLEVTNLNYNQISTGQGFGRYFGRWISILIVGIGYLIQPFNDKRQALHDIMAGTIVIKRSKGKSGLTIFIYCLISLIVMSLLLAVMKAIIHSAYSLLIY